MFETPTIDIQEIRSTLTEVGNTAAGFAVLAAKRANDLRLDATSRYSSQITEFRKQALVVVNRVESVRADMEAAVEPTLAKVLDRLPAPAAKVAVQAQEAVKSFQVKAHDLVVEALTAEVPAAKAATPKSSAASSAKATPAAKKTTAASADAAVKASARRVGRPSNAEVAARADAAPSASAKATKAAKTAKAVKSVKAAKPAAKKVSRTAKPATARKVGRPAKATKA